MATVDHDSFAPESRLRSSLVELDRLLRGDLTRMPSLTKGSIAINPGRLSLTIAVLGMIYGICMGTFSLFQWEGAGPWQMIASMIKVPLLFALTLVVTLPSLYVINALLGSRLSAHAVIRLLIAAFGVMVSVLASLGTIVAFFSVSTTSYPFMVLLNVIVFSVSGFLGLSFLLQTLNRLTISAPDVTLPDAADPESLGPMPVSALDQGPSHAMSRTVNRVFQIWLVVFALVGAQMGWVLRPFIGNPAVPFTWFRGRNSNFFQAVLQTLGNLFS
jgi:hypothetical protein